MISGDRDCGCSPKYSSPSSYNISPPFTTVSKSSAAYSTASDCSSKILNRSKTVNRQNFETPRQKLPNFSKQDEAKCPCPRPGHRNYDSMKGKCSPCCAGVFPETKVISKIENGGKPYKEIEAVINDNRMVIRIQRESVEREWDPPCDCLEDNLADVKRVGRLGGGGSSRCGENVMFRKVDINPCDGEQRQSQSSRGQNCRTVTVFPNPEILSGDNRDDDNDRVKDKKERNERSEVTRLVDLEENPNIFVLRIRKRSENSDRKNNIDLEFRTPRPWVNRPKPIPKPKPIPELPPTKLPSPSDNREEKNAGKKKKKGKK